jgi:hypothetical protein
VRGLDDVRINNSVSDHRPSWQQTTAPRRAPSSEWSRTHERASGLGQRAGLASDGCQRRYRERLRRWCARVLASASGPGEPRRAHEVAATLHRRCCAGGQPLRLGVSWWTPRSTLQLIGEAATGMQKGGGEFVRPGRNYRWCDSVLILYTW